MELHSDTACQIDAVINQLAIIQHGVVARRQLRDAGVRADAIDCRVDRGMLVPKSPRVFRVGGAPDGQKARLMAALLDAGPDVVVSHHSAAALWALPGFHSEPVHVTSVRHRVAKGSLIGVVHEPRCLLPAHQTSLDGIPITTPARTLFDLAGCREIGSVRLERLVDAAWSRRLVSFGALHQMLGDLAKRGRPGIRVMRQVLADRPADYIAPESGLESRFRDLARLAGFRDLRLQVDVSGAEGWIGRVDFCDSDRRLIFEIGDNLHHGSISDRRRDRDRHEALEGDGWLVVEVNGFDIFHRSNALVARLRRLASGTTVARRSA